MITPKHIKPKIAALAGILTAPLLAGTLSTAVSAWGPDRPTYTMESPATSATFNSITNNPTIGDERNFVRVGQIDADVTDLGNEVEVIPGHQYLVYVYYHNDASATFNDAAHHNVGVAFKTKMSTTFPVILNKGERGTVSATITAENTDPLSVWDEAYFTTNYDKLLLHYVEGSAKIYNDWGVNGSVLPISLFSEEGTFLGLNALNGVILGCEEYHGVVTYVVEARELSGSLDKTVSKDGTTYTKETAIAPGDEVYFKLDLTNSGDVPLGNATISDQMPEGLTLVPGSVELWTNDSTTKDPLSDNIVGTGYNLGTIGLGNTVHISYRAKATTTIDCPGRELTNVASFTYDSDEADGITRTSSTSIVVQKDGCTEDPIKPEDPEPGIPSTIVNTGPLEITMAVVVVLAIVGVGIYLWRTRRTLKTVERRVSGRTQSRTKASKPAKSTKTTTKKTVKSKSTRRKK